MELETDANEVALQLDQLAVQKPKQRKVQLEEEYLRQKAQFAQTGPRINTDDWLFDNDRLAALVRTEKTDRNHILHACEKAYFQRDFGECLRLVGRAKELFGVSLDDDDANAETRRKFEELGRKVTKSRKPERHVVEVMKIRDACLQRMRAVASDDE